MYNIKIYFEDDEEMEFECADGEDLITASIRQEIILMSECRDGLCGTCKVLCDEGEVVHGSGVTVQSLPPEEEEEGQIIMCQAFPQSDLELSAPYGSDRVTLGVALPTKTYSSKIMSCEQLTENVTKLELQVQNHFDQPEDFPFIAGQYVTIEVPGTEDWRSYSMANVAKDDGKIELLIRLLDDGCMSNYLRNNAKIGDSVDVKGPFGTFNLHDSKDRSRYFVAGSTGLAPLLSMVREMNDKGDTTPAHLLLGARNKDFLFYEEEIKQLESTMETLQVHIALDDTEDSEWQGFIGNSVEMLKSILTENDETPDIYICGPPGMVTAVEETGRDFSIPTSQIYLERFVASS